VSAQAYTREEWAAERAADLSEGVSLRLWATWDAREAELAALKAEGEAQAEHIAKLITERDRRKSEADAKDSLIAKLTERDRHRRRPIGLRAAAGAPQVRDSGLVTDPPPTSSAPLGETCILCGGRKGEYDRFGTGPEARWLPCPACTGKRGDSSASPTPGETR
jgi:hypothetical protein